MSRLHTFLDRRDGAELSHLLALVFIVCAWVCVVVAMLTLSFAWTVLMLTFTAMTLATLFAQFFPGVHLYTRSTTARVLRAVTGR